MFEEGMKLKASISALLIFFVIAGIATADYYSNKSLTLNIEQSVKGDGYFMNYKSVRMPNAMEASGETSNGVEAKDYAHGSGQMDLESLLSAESSNLTEGAAEDSPAMDYTEALSLIQMTEDSKLTYRPMSMGIGSGFYNLHPINFNSLLKERTWIKNRGGASSMENMIEYAHALDKQLEVKISDFVYEEDPSITMMNVSQNLTNGRAHIGVLQADPDAIEESVITPSAEDTESTEIEIIPLAKSAWRKPLVYVDEDYFGSLHIEKRMNLTSILDTTTEDDYWLPCCYGGYQDMNKMDLTNRGTDGVFDCSCFKVPNRAQFPK
jgi:hypothetical protein